MFIQFSSADATTIVAYFGSPQDPAIYPNQGQVGASDARWAAYIAQIAPQTRQLLPAPMAPA